MKGEQPEPEHIKADVADSVGPELSPNPTEVQENLTLSMEQDDVVQTGRTDLTTVSAELLRTVLLRKTLQAKGTLALQASKPRHCPAHGPPPKLATGRGCTQPENTEIHSKSQEVSLFAKSCTFRRFGQNCTL